MVRSTSLGSFRAGLLVALVSSWMLAPVAATAGDTDSLYLQEALDDLERFGVLGSVLMVDSRDRPRIALASGYVGADRQVPMTPDRGFQIGSQTKTFTAAGILLLAQEGQLALDDPISRYVPDAPDADGVTIRHLLQHTSGMGDGIDLLDTAGEPPTGHFELEDIYLLGRVQGRSFSPGARWHYNNTGYDILGRIIEVVSGESRPRFLRERILEPLAMDNTWFGSTEDWPVDDMARGYAWSERAGEALDMTGPADLSWADAAGDMLTTAPDLVKWWRSLLDPAAPTGLALADFTSDAVPTGIPDMMSSYGYGLGHFRLAGRSAWGHGGNIHGYVSLSAVNPETGTVVVLLSSTSGLPETTFPALKTALTLVVATALVQDSG